MKIESLESDLDLLTVKMTNVSFSGIETLIVTLDKELEVLKLENNSSLTGSALVNEITTMKRHVSEIMSAY